MVRWMKKRSVFWILLCIGVTSCKPVPSTVLCDVNCKAGKLQPHHITPVNEIAFTPGGRSGWKELFNGVGDAYTVTALALKPYTAQNIADMFGCAANRYAQSHGYADWGSEGFTVTEYMKSNIMEAREVIIMYKAPLPDGVKTLGHVKDWCRLAPREAL